MNENTQKILMVGAGAMAIEYAKVLKALNFQSVVIGRGEASAKRFEEATGITALTGDLSSNLESLKGQFDTAIVTVNAQYLTAVSIELMDAGIKRLLVEKPVALDFDELRALNAAIDASGAELYVAYNRRFLSSVIAARKMVEEDGGIRSVKFDFSEAARRIGSLNKPQRELDTWFYGNSTHVLDLAFHFFGKPTELEATIQPGGVDWSKTAGVFVGHGRNKDDALISWHANWASPGRWGMEVLTAKRRLILQPLEKLRFQDHEGFGEHDVELDDEDDINFKPGLMKQVRAFLFSQNKEFLPTWQEHAEFMPFYEQIRTGEKQ